MATMVAERLMQFFTNGVILKLGFREFKDEDGTVIKVIPVLIKVQIKRETTREELGDKTDI